MSKRVLCAGGGSLGPVMPLVAMAESLLKLHSDVEIIWAGTIHGPERDVIVKHGWQFHELPLFKFPRYFSSSWLRMPGSAWQAYRTAKQLLQQIQPSVIVSAGGFTAVPLVYAAHDIPVLSHQLDYVPGLANRLTARRSAMVTTSFAYSSSPFSGAMTKVLPTPVRFRPEHVPTRITACRQLGLAVDQSVILVIGGGQGAQAINEAVRVNLDDWLLRTQIVHSTGLGKGVELCSLDRPGYRAFSLLDDAVLTAAYAAADVVVTRAGMGALSEIAALSLPTIMVPLPKSHQVVNAKHFVAADGAIMLHETTHLAVELNQQLKNLLSDEYRRFQLASNAHRCLSTDDGTALAKEVSLLLT